MNNKTLKIVLITLLCLIGIFIIFTIATHNNRVSIKTSNIKKGEVLIFDDVSIEVLNVASSTCPKETICSIPDHTEISIKVKYNNEISYYTLDTYFNNKQRIENSNYYIICKYVNNKATIEVKDKNEI